ncbi:MAG: phage tail protein [Alphaproteobacteria bacterium]|nr:phage tail protein [Alphaproteobacteria bacterium]
MILGDFQFSLKSLSPNTLSRTTEFNWSDAERIGDLPNLQNLGISKDQIEIEGVFYPKFTKENSINNGNSITSRVMNFLNLSEDSGYDSIEAIRTSNLCKIASNLISDDGEILGKFVITSIKETQSYFDANGKPQKIEFTLTLKKSPSTTNSSVVLNNDSSASFVDTLTNLARSYLRW